MHFISWLSILGVLLMATFTGMADETQPSKEELLAKIQELKERYQKPDPQNPQTYWIKEYPRQLAMGLALEDLITRFPGDPQQREWEKRMMGCYIQVLQSKDEEGAKAKERLLHLLNDPNVSPDIVQHIYLYRIAAVGTDNKFDPFVPLDPKEYPTQMQKLIREFAEKYPNSEQLGEFYYESANFVSQRKDIISDSEKADLIQTWTNKALELGSPMTKQNAKELSFRNNIIGNPPPPLTFVALDGTQVDVAALKGKVVLLDFWATWCGPCVAQLPEIKELYNKYHAQGLEVIGISFDKNKAQLEAFLKEKDITWPQYFDGMMWNNTIAKQFLVNAIPSLWLIDRSGKVAAIDPDNLESIVAEKTSEAVPQ